MKRSSIKIWRSAGSNLEDLPSRLPEMSEPQYAALLFTKACMSCGKTTGSRADPFLLVSLCSVCRETELKDVYGELRMGLVPVTNLMSFRLKRIAGRTLGNGNITYGLVRETQEVIKQRDELRAKNDATALEAWKLGRKELVNVRHTVRCSFVLRISVCCF